MRIDSLIRNVYVPSRIALSGQYVKLLYRVANGFSEHLGHPARLCDLTEQNICRYLSAYRRLWSARATNNQRQVLLSLYQDAADRMKLQSLLPPEPNRRRIRKLPEEVDPPTAWTELQVADLFRYCQSLHGRVGDVPACDWWLSLFDAIYWTSSRIGSMLAVHSNHYDGKGLLIHRQKNKRPQWYPLPVSCRELIERTRPGCRRLIWQHPWHPRTVWVKARKIIEEAGLPAPRTGRNLFYRLRRTTITLCARVDPAVAQQIAGHRDYATTLRHYIDPRMLHRKTAVDILPDPLDSGTVLYATKTPRFRIIG